MSHLGTTGKLHHAARLVAPKSLPLRSVQITRASIHGHHDNGILVTACRRICMRRKKIGALTTVIMHERDHIMLVEPRDQGMMATVLRSPYEVRNPKDVFAGIKKIKITGELVKVAELLIERKMGKFTPSEFKDHYEDALIALVKAKRAGRKIKEVELPSKPTSPSNVLEALKQSLAESTGRPHPRRARGTRTRARQPSRRAAASAKKRA